MPWMSDDDLLRIRAAMEAAIPHLNTYAAQLARYPVEDCHALVTALLNWEAHDARLARGEDAG